MATTSGGEGGGNFMKGAIEADGYQIRENHSAWTAMGHGEPARCAEGRKLS